ncbi:FCD domain-containing protein [Shimia ponticola]|uniref:FCD domain-containing protein n=1 Tax=Shimia ponticola TaxID=2582893 RepID=UPI001C9A7382|nr:FCD domain-containing protein [Shimia ponticola]
MVIRNRALWRIIGGHASVNEQSTQLRFRAADTLVSAIEERIRNGDLRAGDPLPPEREIVRDHGVSRTVVREALRILASKALITARPGFRPVVARLGYDAALDAVGSVAAQLLEQPDGVRNLFDMRVRIEASLARDAAKSATSEQIEEMEAALEANRAAIPDTKLFYETDVAFHSVLHTVPGNPMLPALHRAFTAWLAPNWIKMPRLPKRNEINYEAHKAIFDAILRRDPDKAETALRDHLDFAWNQVSDIIEGARH